MNGPACMTDEEWAEWLRPILGFPVRGYPCADCPASFAAAALAVGKCDGWPGARTRTMALSRRPIPTLDGRLKYGTDEERREARRAQWRAYRQRRRQSARAAA